MWIIKLHSIVVMTVVMNTLDLKDFKHNEAFVGIVRLSGK